MKMSQKDKKLIKKNCKCFWNSFKLTLLNGGGASIIGFIMSQLVWIWILRSFLFIFFSWFIEMSNYVGKTVLELTILSWKLYLVWFTLVIIMKLLFTKIE